MPRVPVLQFMSTECLTLKQAVNEEKMTRRRVPVTASASEKKGAQANASGVGLPAAHGLLPKEHSSSSLLNLQLAAPHQKKSGTRNRCTTDRQAVTNWYQPIALQE